MSVQSEFSKAARSRRKAAACDSFASNAMSAEDRMLLARMQRLDEFYYGWGAGIGDFNRDGTLDVVSGPYYYLGPTYTTRHEIYVAPTADTMRWTMTLAG